MIPSRSKFQVFPLLYRWIRKRSQRFVWIRMDGKSLGMSYDHYKCLATNNNILRLLTKMLRKQYEYAFLANFRSMLLIFATPHERRGSLVVSTPASYARGRRFAPRTRSIACIIRCKILVLYITDCVSLCLSDETLKAVGPFNLVSMPGEVNIPLRG